MFRILKPSIVLNFAKYNTPILLNIASFSSSSNLLNKHMQQIYDTNIKTKINYCELSYWFNHNTDIMIKHSSNNNKSIVDSLIYGKSCVLKPNDLDKILSHVMISKNNKQIQIDNYVIKQNNEISWNDNIAGLQPAISNLQKYNATNAIIALMNNIDPSQLNIVNRKMLTDYVKKYIDITDTFYNVAYFTLFTYSLVFCVSTFVPPAGVTWIG